MQGDALARMARMDEVMLAVSEQLAIQSAIFERIANTLQRLQHVVDLAYRQGWGSPPIRRD